MNFNYFSTLEHEEHCVPITPIVKKNFDHFFNSLNQFLKNKLSASKFRAGSGEYLLSLNEEGKLQEVFLGLDSEEDFWAFSVLPPKLPEGDFYIRPTLDEGVFHLSALAWGLGSYQFDRYKAGKDFEARLFLPSFIDREILINTLSGIYLIRDLINTPNQDLGPQELTEVLVDVGKAFKAKTKVISADSLLKKGFSMIHAVGRGSTRPPMLAELRWGNPKHPKLTLVGKGVCFDSGGYDLKTTAGMLTMRKDMGGAAHVIALAQMIMSAELPVCLRVLIPAVENLVSGSAYRPGDILLSKKGLSVEINNTDAEGRLILADALADACLEKPDLLIDFATLTGASTIALGGDIPAIYSNQNEVAKGFLKAAEKVKDPAWEMPLYLPYLKFLESDVADISNAALSANGAGGSITAALFLAQFVEKDIPWVHFDIYAYNPTSRPGRPKGGDAHGLRLTFEYIRERFANK